MQSNLRPARQLLVFGVIAAGFLLTGASGSGAAAPTCEDYRSQAAAQDHFLAAGGGVAHPVGKLDTDRDGVACEGLGGPYAGFATLGYNKRKNFFYGTASLPPSPSGKGFACMFGNRRSAHAPRRVNVYRVGPGGKGEPIFNRSGLAAEGRPRSGRLVWRGDRKVVVPGRYYAEFEERAARTPSRGTRCPSFRSGIVHLPS
jgi:hypothetical protein